MEHNIFIPRTNGHGPEAAVPEEQPRQPKQPKQHQYAQLLSFLLGAVIIFTFVPGVLSLLGFTKVLVVSTVLSGIIVLLLWRFFKTGTAELVPSAPLGVFWLFCVCASIGSLLAPDPRYSFFGTVFEPGTAGFWLVCALVMSVPFVTRMSAHTVRYTLLATVAAAVVAVVYVLLRILFGADVLQLYTFTEATVSPLGSFNDAATIAALVIVFAILATTSRTRSRLQQAVACVCVGLGVWLALLSSIAVLWWLLGLFSLIVIGWLSGDVKSRQRQVPLALCFLVLLVSAGSLWMPDTVSQVAQRLGAVEYVEVRPSIPASADVLQAVYADSLLLGAGPQMFLYQWREHKDTAIMETQFWGTDFVAGHSRLFTAFIELGVLGGGLLVGFLGWFAFVVVRAMLRPCDEAVEVWRRLVIGSGTAARFLWVVFSVYVPGVVVLLLTALFSGLALFAAAKLSGAATWHLQLSFTTVLGRLARIGAVAAAVCVVFVVLGTVWQQYTAVLAAQKETQKALHDRDMTVFVDSYNAYSDSRFLTPILQQQAAQLVEINSLPEPTDIDRAEFEALAKEAVLVGQAAQQAELLDTANHLQLAAIYNALAVAGVADARPLAIQTITAASTRDPKSPLYPFLTAQLQLQAGEVDLARQALAEAVQRKRNYTPALEVLAQLDINEGNLPEAIATTESIITLEPNNPARYFQLGLLYVANQQLSEAEAVYKAAIEIDPQHANARYMLAQVYLATDRPTEAQEHLQVVQQTNPDNETVAQLLTKLAAGEPPTDTPDTAIDEQSPQTGQGNTVITDAEPRTVLISPVNSVGE